MVASEMYPAVTDELLAEVVGASSPLGSRDSSSSSARGRAAMPARTATWIS
jgi:hypothetical protein